MPLTSSLYVPGRIRDPEHVVVDVGTGYYIKKVRSSRGCRAKLASKRDVERQASSAAQPTVTGRGRTWRGRTWRIATAVRLRASELAKDRENLVEMARFQILPRCQALAFADARPSLAAGVS